MQWQLLVLYKQQHSHCNIVETQHVTFIPLLVHVWRGIKWGKVKKKLVGLDARKKRAFELYF